jgi:hypothetical protein
MNAKEFFGLVKEMRIQQKQYFKTRSSDVLRKSKALEKRVDDEIERVEKVMNEKKQGCLF